MPAAKVRACTILAELGQAQVELVGKAVILTNGTAGTVESVLLDEFHGLRISVKGAKLWAGDCVAASELRGAVAAETPSLPERASEALPPDPKQ